MPVDEKEIGIAVIIVVEKLQAPAAEQLGRRRDLTRLVGEDQLALVPIQTEELLIDIGDEQVLPTIGIVIGRINTHSRSRPAGFNPV